MGRLGGRAKSTQLMTVLHSSKSTSESHAAASLQFLASYGMVVAVHGDEERRFEYGANQFCSPLFSNNLFRDSKGFITMIR
jgi:hypothetical protein